MATRYPHQCALIIIADGFDESETVTILSALREAGIYTKSVGLTSGLIHGAHGIWLMPDCTLADVYETINMNKVCLVVLPGGEQTLARLEPDPRLHRILRRALENAGTIATSAQGARVLRIALGQNADTRDVMEHQIMLRNGLEQSVDRFAGELVRRLERAPAFSYA